MMHLGRAGIYGYVTRAVPMPMKMFEKRLRGYGASGHALDQAPLGLREIEDEAVVESSTTTRCVATSRMPHQESDGQQQQEDTAQEQAAQ